MAADHALSLLVALGLLCGPGLVRHAEAHAGALPEALDLLTHGTWERALPRWLPLLP